MLAFQMLHLALQVTYPMELASLLHLAPLALTILILVAMMKSTSNSWAKIAPVAKQAGLSVISFLCAVAVPAAVGALRAGISGAYTAQGLHLTHLVCSTLAL